MKLVDIVAGRLRSLAAACSGSGRALRDWLFDPGPANEREQRGRKLLLEWLSDAQRLQYQQLNYFDVTGCHSGKRYRIHHGMGTNIYELDHAGRALTGWCFVPEGYLVAGDVMLAQKIALETDEKGALRLANNFSLR